MGLTRALSPRSEAAVSGTGVLTGYSAPNISQGLCHPGLGPPHASVSPEDPSGWALCGRRLLSARRPRGASGRWEGFQPWLVRCRAGGREGSARKRRRTLDRRVLVQEARASAEGVVVVSAHPDRARTGSPEPDGGSRRRRRPARRSPGRERVRCGVSDHPIMGGMTRAPANDRATCRSWTEPDGLGCPSWTW
jgi:hypothetical protein